MKDYIVATANGLEAERKLREHTGVPAGLIDRINAMVDAGMEGVDANSRRSNPGLAWKTARDLALKEGVTEEETLKLLGNVAKFRAEAKLANLGIQQ